MQAVLNSLSSSTCLPCTIVLYVGLPTLQSSRPFAALFVRAEESTVSDTEHLCVSRRKTEFSDSLPWNLSLCKLSWSFFLLCYSSAPRPSLEERGRKSTHSGMAFKTFPSVWRELVVRSTTQWWSPNPRALIPHFYLYSLSHNICLTHKCLTKVRGWLFKIEETLENK